MKGTGPRPGRRSPALPSPPAFDRTAEELRKHVGRLGAERVAELLRVLVELRRAEDASARAAWVLAEAEEADPARPKEVARARERYEAAVAAVEAARARRREIEAQFSPAEVARVHGMSPGTGRG